MNNPWKALSKVNPQRDDPGWRGINGKIWTAFISAKLPGAVYQVVMYVIDRSWGYDLPSISLGYSPICKATRLSKRAVITAVQIAEKSRILVVDHGSTQTRATNCYLFNKHYDTWVTSEVNNTSEVKGAVTSEVNGMVTSEVLTHEVSLPILKVLNKKEKGNIDSFNKRNNNGGNREKPPDRSDKYFKGVYGHNVQGRQRDNENVELPAG